MKRALRTILISLTLVLPGTGCSVFDSEVTVTDLSFEVSPEIVWNAEYLAYTLRLSLASGTEGDYGFTYSIDGDPLLRLETAGGGSAIPGSDITLSRQGGAVFILPELAQGERHTIVMEFTREGVSRSCTLDLPDTLQRAVGVRVDASSELDFTRVILTNLMGASVTAYTVTFSLDGETLDEMKYMSSTFGGTMQVDFARSESYTFELPYVVAGEHVLRVDVQSTLGSESTSVGFTEPQRRQTSLEFSYNAYNGNLMVSSAYNPAGTAFSITLDVTVRGTVTYRHEQFFGIADPSSESFTETGENIIKITPGIQAVTVDGGLIKKLLDSVHGNSRTDAATAIGNGNARTVYTDITTVMLALTIHSEGDYAGRTAVTISPTNGSYLPIKYTYTGTTWHHDKGYVHTITPGFTVNGGPASQATLL